MSKKLTITVVLVAIGMTSFAHKKDVDYLLARRNGADAKIVVSLLNDDGNPVSNATVRVLMGMNFREKAYYIDGITNPNGQFVVEGKTTGNEIEIAVSKDGYYNTSKKLSFATMGKEYDTRDGKWLPWGMECGLRMREIRNPTALVSDVNGYYVPVTNKWIGFDMKTGDWVMSGCKGKVSDFEVFLEWDGKPSRESQLLNLSLRAVDMNSGFYYADLVPESVFHGVYNASTNAVLSQRLSCQTKQQDGRIVKHGLPTSKLLVLRSRCICDADGTLRQANYSAISWIVVDGTRKGKGEMMLSYSFNPTPNDTNLEPK